MYWYIFIFTKLAQSRRNANRKIIPNLVIHLRAGYQRMTDIKNFLFRLRLSPNLNSLIKYIYLNISNYFDLGWGVSFCSALSSRE
jgi:hypothetical protein